MTRGATLVAAVHLTAGLLTAACAPQGTEAERRRDAARADSSAAGYEVGPLTPVPPATTQASPVPAVVATAPRPSARTTDPRATVDGRQKTAPARPPSATSRTEAIVVPTAASPHNPAQPAPIPPAPAPVPVGTGPVQDGEFLWYDASQKLMKVRLIAGYTGVNDGLNFNGGTGGDRTVVVPLGWRVVVTVANDDDALTHSALVAPHELPVPPEPPAPAFEGARIASLARGLPNGESEEMRFTASRAGQFLLMCGVPGHGEGGMWISVEVSESAAVPAYR